MGWEDQQLAEIHALVGELHDVTERLREKVETVLTSIEDTKNRSAAREQDSA